MNTQSSPLAVYFREQAEWREGKAQEHPEDERNAQSAEALRSLAEFVDSDTHEAASSLRTLELFEYDTGVFSPPQPVQRAVSRYGFDYPVTEWTHRDFLAEIVLLIIESLYEENAREHGEDPTGLLHDFELEAAREGVILGPQYFRRRERSAVVELEAWVREARMAQGGDA